MSGKIRRTNTLMPFFIESSMKRPVLSRLTYGFFTSSKKKKTFPTVISTMKETGASLCLFETGMIVVGGLNSDVLTRISADLYCHLVNSRAPLGSRLATVVSYDKTNDVYAFKLGCRIDIKRYYEDNKHNTTVTGKFNSVSTKMGEDRDKRSFTLIIFASGRINVIGIRRSQVDKDKVHHDTPLMLKPYMIPLEDCDADQ